MKFSVGADKQNLSHNDVTIEIPAGAVSDLTEITIIPLKETEIENLNPGMINLTSPDAGYRFLFNGKPHGIFKSQSEFR